MGFFSWVCKGCGQELHEGELVRLNGCKGEYDGYGRTIGCSQGAGGFDFGECSGTVVAWHEVCYQKATPEQKLDETPSRSARNQGCGEAIRMFLPENFPKAMKRPRWTLIKKFKGGHRLFKDAERPEDVAIADQSGTYPNQTDDGILYLDPLRYIAHYKIDGGYGFTIPLKNSQGARYGTPAGLEQALWIANAYGMAIDLPDAGLVKVNLELIPVPKPKPKPQKVPN